MNPDTLGTLVTFSIYLVAMLGIGLWSYRQTSNLEEYLLGGRQLGRWVTALSAQASDMSGWLLMGLPGALYLSGVGELWMVGGLWLGTCLNWIVVAPRLREQTAALHAITLPAYFERRFAGTRTDGDPDAGRNTGLLGLTAALVILLFFTLYSAAGLVASALLFEAVLGIPYGQALWIGAGVVLTYTALGGFLAVSWTDLIQGLLILLALVAVPIAALFFELDPGTALKAGASTAEGALALALPLSKPFAGGPWAILSAVSWGLGYFGQPHILARFMAVRSQAELRGATRIAMTWVSLAMGGAVAVGLIGASLYPGGLENAERVFIREVQDLFNPWVGGVMLAAILAAIMSTIDSQLLVSSSALSEDAYSALFQRQASEKERLWIGRAAVVLITALAVGLAQDRSSTVLGLVKYAWGGLGASFGPLILLALLSRQRITYSGALAGLLTGAIVTVTWRELGLGETLYEIIPGFVASGLMILAVSSVTGARDQARRAS